MISGFKAEQFVQGDFFSSTSGGCDFRRIQHPDLHLGRNVFNCQADSTPDFCSSADGGSSFGNWCFNDCRFFDRFCGLTATGTAFTVSWMVCMAFGPMPCSARIISGLRRICCTRSPRVLNSASCRINAICSGRPASRILTEKVHHRGYLPGLPSARVSSSRSFSSCL